MDFTKLTKRAKDVLDQRGGMQSVVDDAKELRDIATRKDGSASDKLKEAASALRTPGAGDQAAEPPAPVQEAPAREASRPPQDPPAA